jgi:hypothetical protein
MSQTSLSPSESGEFIEIDVHIIHHGGSDARGLSRCPHLCGRGQSLFAHLRAARTHGPPSVGPTETPGERELPAIHGWRWGRDESCGDLELLDPYQRQLFRGREDVFARLWTNPRKQTTGYAPACANEWVRGLCDKPRVKCGDCPNQAFLKFDEQAVLGHLQCRHIIGAYQLLPDETCRFLAVDFDGEAWRDDVTAVSGACESVGMPPAVECSRSGVPML